MSEETYRHELKFVCGEQALRLMEERIRLVCRRDSHAGAGGYYAIRSLYFDTYDDRFLYESLSGVDRRHKYRIRIYNGSGDMIRLERKSSRGGLKRKESCRITRAQCGQMAGSLPIEGIGPEQELLRQFAAERACTLLGPRVIVEYIRTPYVYPIGNVRVTFDRHISSREGGNLFDGNAPGKGVMPEGLHVLEVKYDGVLPGAIRELLGGGGNLRAESFSKYVLCRRSQGIVGAVPGSIGCLAEGWNVTKEKAI